MKFGGSSIYPAQIEALAVRHEAVEKASPFPFPMHGPDPVAA
jgi:hypothetical protein